jgi:trehalose 6-phosphate synthase
MNLVSKEGPAVNRKDGALVLSHGAGSYEELGAEAVVIDDPLDIAKTAAAMERALEMDPGERKQRAESLREKVNSRRPGHWIDAQLDDLSAISEGGEPLTPASSG